MAGLLGVLPSATEGGAVTTIMQSQTVGLVASYNSDELMRQDEDNNIVPVLPYCTGTPTHVYCSETRRGLSDFKGVQVAGSSASIAIQSGALGASFSSIPYNEYYGACSVASLIA